MRPTWRSAIPPPLPVIRLAGWVRVVLRAVPLALLLGTGLLVLVPLRLAEQIAGSRRLLSPHVPRLVSRAVLGLIGVKLVRQGALDPRAGVVVANHASWLDIFALNALGCLTFVSKAEVAGWAGIGLLARAAGTLFIARDPRKAQAQQGLIRDRLASRQRLVLFAEGTSTDGLRVLPFKPTLFAAVQEAGSPVQPVSVQYRAPPGRDHRFYGWWADMDFVPHALAVLAEGRRGQVAVMIHPAIDSAGFGDRKALALACEAVVRQGKEELAAQPHGVQAGR